MRVAINGTGIAGPTLAYSLRRFGHQSVLFERAPSTRLGGSSSTLGPWLRHLRADGYRAPPPGRCYKMERLSMVDASGAQVAGLDIRPIREQLRGRFISLARADLAAALLSACRDVPTHFGVSIIGIERQDGDGVTATLSDQRQERFDLVVGADGLHSHVRELVFGREPRFETPLGCHVAASRCQLSRRVVHTLPGSKQRAGRIALRGGDTLVLLICRST